MFHSLYILDRFFSYAIMHVASDKMDWHFFDCNRPPCEVAHDCFDVLLPLYIGGDYAAALGVMAGLDCF